MKEKILGSSRLETPFLAWTSSFRKKGNCSFRISHIQKFTVVMQVALTAKLLLPFKNFTQCHLTLPRIQYNEYGLIDTYIVTCYLLMDMALL